MKLVPYMFTTRFWLTAAILFHIGGCTPNGELSEEQSFELEKLTARYAEHIKVTKDGTAIILEGLVKEENEKQRVENAFKHLDWVKEVQNRLNLLTPIQVDGLNLPPNIYGTSYAFDGKQLSIQGGVPFDSELRGLKSITLETPHGPVQVALDTTQIIEGFGAIQDWSGFHQKILSAIAQSQKASFALTSKQLFGYLEVEREYNRYAASKAISGWDGFIPPEVRYKLIKPELSVEASMCQNAVTTALKSGHIELRTTLPKEKMNAKSELSANCSAVLDDVLSAMKRCPNYHWTIETHQAQDKGDRAESQKLATAIKKWLSTRGIAEGTLKAIGYGNERPIADVPAEGKNPNTRVEIRIQPKPELAQPVRDKAPKERPEALPQTSKADKQQDRTAS